jgi:hypothetical protein
MEAPKFVTEEIFDCAANGVYPWALPLHLSRKALQYLNWVTYEAIQVAYDAGRHQLIAENPDCADYGDWMRPNYR